MGRDCSGGDGRTLRPIPALSDHGDRPNEEFFRVKFVDPIKALIAAGYDYKVDAVRGIAGSRLGAGAALPPLLLDDDGL